MKILSYHPFSLYENGGGNRILRRLYEGREADITSLVVEGRLLNPHQGKYQETVVYASPVNRKWARWKLRNWLIKLRVTTFKPYTIRKLQNAAEKVQYDVLHVVNHGTFSAALCDERFIKGKQLWVSFHDHFNEIKSPVEETRLLWNRADRRLVISDELGGRYNELFGNQPYELITDGVLPGEISAPAKFTADIVTIYFAGLLHMTYVPLFNTLADALDKLSAGGLRFKVILRGTQHLKFMSGRSFETEYRPMTLNNAELKAELDASAILYLPIKFTTPDFYLYSLSTKMVGYLGAPGTILYHGPADSAACRLLEREQAAICCGSLAADDLAKHIKNIINGGEETSAKAKTLAKGRFDLNEIRRRFWLDAPASK